MKFPFVAAGVQRCLGNSNGIGSHQSSIPGSQPVSRSISNRALSMNLSASPSPQSSPKGEGVADDLRRLGQTSPHKPSPSIPANPRPNPSRPAERLLPLPPAGEGRGEGRSRSSSLSGSWSLYVSEIWKTLLPMNLPASSSSLRVPIRESQRDSVPKPGVRPRRGPTPGGRFRKFTTPTGLRTAGATPLGLAPMHDLPGVARSSQPRALGRNPFGIGSHRSSPPVHSPQGSQL